MTGGRAGSEVVSRRDGEPARFPRATARRSSAQDRFDQRLHARRRRSWKLAGAVVVLALLLVGAWWVLWRSDWVLVEKVVVSGVEPRWEQEILSVAAIPKPQPMVEVDTEGATVAVRQLAIVKDVQVRRSWPTTIAIVVTPRRPVLAVREGPAQFALVDDDGVTVESVAAAPEGVPTLLTRGEAGATPAAYRAAWAVISSLPDTVTAEVTAVTVSSADLLTLELGERTIVWGGPEDHELKLEVVEALLAAGEGYIDVSAPRTPVTRPS
jgi:cell division protein FtsQ